MFVPGHRARMVDRALGAGEFGPSGLDVAILDLEDGVPPAEKAAARTRLAAALARPAGATARYVRVNAVAAGMLADDAAAVARPGLDGVVVPKVATASEIDSLAAAFDARITSPIEIVASIESARALVAAPAIAAHPRVTALLFGAEDFALDLGLPSRREAEASELIYARSALVVAAVASGRASIDGIWPDIDDLDGLRRDALRARRLGFTGKSLIHPKHIETINGVFAPSPEEVARAMAIVRAFDEANAKGLGAVAFGGELLDQPIVERARRIVAAAAAPK